MGISSCVSLFVAIIFCAAAGANEDPVVATFPTSRLTIDNLTCEPGRQEALVSGSLGGVTLDRESMTLSPDLCARILVDYTAYPNCREGRTDLFDVVKHVQRGRFYDSFTYELMNFAPSDLPSDKQSFCKAKPKNFRRISPFLYAGSRPGAEELNYLKALGVKVIVDLQGGNYSEHPVVAAALSLIEPGEDPLAVRREMRAAMERGMEFKSLEMGSFNMTKANEDAIAEALKLLSTTAQPVYLHCENGVDRTGLVISIFRVENLHQPFAAVLDEWQTLRSTRLSESLTRELVKYFTNRDSSR